MDNEKKRKHNRRMNWTGEDIDMLREREEGSKGRTRATSDDYKNHIDGA